jgi:hypothetical protein
MTSFDIKHNNDNDGIAKIYMYLAYSCSGSIQPEDLLVGKILLDTSLQHNKIRATMGIQYILHLTQQHQQWSQWKYPVMIKLWLWSPDVISAVNLSKT